MDFGELVDLPQAEISEEAFVPCPAADGFAQVRVRNHCPQCPHFGGFVKLAPKSDDVHFIEIHRVRCGHPIARRMVIVKT